MRIPLPVFLLSLCGLRICSAQEPIEFSVVAYNVENLFDVDGVALFKDYEQNESKEGDPFTYTRRKLRAKLAKITEVLRRLGEPTSDGPEIILFQELEADFTPKSAAVDYGAFLESHSDRSASDMLAQTGTPRMRAFLPKPGCSR